MSSEQIYKSLLWQSRRGMLELDVLLEPFTRNVFAQLSVAEQGVYERLLGCEDPDLFTWFMSDQRPDDVELAHMIDKVLQHGRYDPSVA